jgi:hypothetical protein
MSNMDYCKFQNILNDLRECYDAMYDELSPEEESARDHIIELCKSIVKEFAVDEIPTDCPYREFITNEFGTDTASCNWSPNS